MGWARLTRTQVEGRKVVEKTTDYDARVEANGLEALAAAGAPVPAVISATEDRLVMEAVGGPPDWEGLGRALARVHAHTAPAYGYEIPNFIGALSQPNPWTESWSEFYARQRLEPYLPDLPADLAGRLTAAIDDGRLAGLLDHGQRPSLVHGDLWSGNVVEGRWLIDPAVHYADRELDHAFSAVFGELPDRMWRAYEEVWPLDEGWARRRPVLQIYHLLVHVRLFGSSYVRQVAERLDRIGW
jgi:fructosamine-3-kinase